MGTKTRESGRCGRLLNHIEEMSCRESDGKRLEEAAIRAAAILPDRNLAKCEAWADWGGREKKFPGLGRGDLGIDAVGTHFGTGARPVALQCKARKLDAGGKGAPINKDEIIKFTSAAAGDGWSTRWIVTNGDVAIGTNVLKLTKMQGRPLTSVNLVAELRRRLESLESMDGVGEPCPIAMRGGGVD